MEHPVRKVELCLESLKEIEQLLAQQHAPGRADRIYELATSIFRQAPHPAIGDLARRVRSEAEEQNSRRLATYLRYLRDELEAVKADETRGWVSATVDRELRIAELEEETEAMRDGLSRIDACLEATTTLLELVVRRANVGPDEAFELAKAIDLEVEKALSLRKKDDDPGIAWLRRVRDDLISWYKLAPSVRKAIADGGLRVIPSRERMQVIEGGLEQTPNATTDARDPTRDE